MSATLLPNIKQLGGKQWGVVYIDTTVNQAYLMDSLLCHTHPLQGLVEVVTSPSPSLGQCVLLNKDTTVNQAYLMDNLSCHTHPLQGHV